MKKNLSRRAFLMGSGALASTPIWANPVYRVLNNPETVAKTIPYYPPSLLGLRGDHDGSQNHAHSAAFGKKYALPTEFSEEYDLVVVGAGVSGLAAAYRFQQKQPHAKILILDNHEDFGGHAIRNEFMVDGQLLISYGGSESIDSPESVYSPQSKQLLKELGVDYKKFHQYFQQDLYEKKWGVTHGVFFSDTVFQADKVVAPYPEVGSSAKTNAKSIAQFPMNENDKRILTELFNRPKNYLYKQTPAQRKKYVRETSYYDFLKNQVGLSETGLNYLKSVSLDYWGHAINAVSVLDAHQNQYAGVQNLGLPKEKDEKEPYIYHFPDGNASIARLLVRKMIPNVAVGNTMEDVVTAKFDYHQLDKPENAVRIRLNSTALRLENLAQGGVGIAYLHKGDNELKAVRAKKAIYAGHAILGAHIISGMPENQRQAMKNCVKMPMVYAKVALKNARAFKKLGVYHLYLPSLPYCLMQLDYPVSMGDYRHAQTPDEPIVLHCVRIAAEFEGKTNREMYKMGRAKLASQKLEDLQKELLDILSKIYALAGEKMEDAVVDVRFNRWAHGYAYEQNTLWDTDAKMAQETSQMQKSIGNIFMANSDVAWMPYLNGAIDQGFRASDEALQGLKPKLTFADGVLK